MKQPIFVMLLSLFIVACGMRNPSPATTATPQIDVEALEATATPEQVTVAPTVSATPAPEEGTSSDAIVDELRNSVQPRVLETRASPNGARLAEVVRYDCTPVREEGEMAYEQLTIADEVGTDSDVVDSQLLNCGGLDAAGLGGLFWSPDGRYFYYTTGREGVPDGCGFWQRPVNRVNVETLQTETLGAGPQSPDGSKLVTWQEGELVVWDVSGGESLRLPAAAPDLARGPIVWAPDNQSLVYLQVDSFCPLSGVSHLLRVDVDAQTQEQLLESESPTFGSAAWTSNEEIALMDETGAEWRYLIATGELSSRE